jgi:hypothetical protein
MPKLPAALNTTPFEIALAKKFEEKGLSPNTIVLYLKNLKKLNGNRPMHDFKFLYQPNKIVNFIMPKPLNVTLLLRWSAP